MRTHIIIQTGNKALFSVEFWEDEEPLIKNRKNMESFLDTLPPILEEISPELGVIDSNGF